MPQGSILNPVLFNILIFNPDDGGECTLTKFTDNAHQGGVADPPEGHAAIQQDLDRQERGAGERGQDIRAGTSEHSTR